MTHRRYRRQPAVVFQTPRGTSSYPEPEPARRSCVLDDVTDRWLLSSPNRGDQLERMDMRRIVALVLLLFVSAAANACQSSETERPPAQTQAMDTSTAIATAQRLHDELNQLEIGRNIDGQGKYFADDVVRLDPNRPPQKGKEAFLSYARQMSTVGYQVESATTRVMHAWSDGTRLVEYGTTELKGTFGGVAGEDPVNYLAVWRINPANPSDAQIETIIWNTQKPVAGLERIAQ